MKFMERMKLATVVAATVIVMATVYLWPKPERVKVETPATGNVGQAVPSPKK